MPEPKSDKDIIWGWKTIASYLEKDIRTLYRWERDFGFPVHRCDPESPKSKIYAYKDELDEWLRNRKNKNANQRERFLLSRQFWLFVALPVFVLVSTMAIILLNKVVLFHIVWVRDINHTIKTC